MPATIKPTTFVLRFSTTFFNDWRTGFGRGQHKMIHKGETLIVTCRERKGAIKPGERLRCKLESDTQWQAVLEVGLDIVTREEWEA